MQSPGGEIVKIFKRFPEKLLPGTILLLAAALRIKALFSELQYDEIWTIANFTHLDTGRILTDLSLPNNHPVNTLILKFLCCFSENPSILRMGVFVCGIISVILIGRIAASISDQKSSPATAMLLAAVSPALILYSATARGYIFQVAGLLMMIYALIQHGKDEKSGGIVPMIVGGGILACLAVPSGVMFIPLIFAGYWWIVPSERRFSRNIIIPAAVLIIFILSYYLPLYSQLRTGQQWGITIDSFSTWLNFAVKTLAAQLPPFTAMLVLSGVIFNPAMRKVFLLTLLPVIFAVITKGGPERVYLILTAIYIIIAADGFSALVKCFPNRKTLLVIFLLAGSFANGFLMPDCWRLPEYSRDLNRALINSGETVLPVLPGSAGMPVTVNAPQLAEQLEVRAAMPLSHILMLHTPSGNLNGADAQNSETVLPISYNGIYSKECGGFLYTLTPVEIPGKSDSLLLAVIPGNPPPEFSAGKLRLNIWLNRKFQLFICREEQMYPFYFNDAKYYRIGGEK